MKVRDRLILFTRYPEPGRTKTRLIPALGPEGAAELQRQMTEHTLAQARAIAPGVDLEIRFSGGSPAQMQAWLGDDVTCVPQGEGDLGDRLLRAVQDSFDQGIERVVVIGSDCPELDTARLEQAFAALEHQDIVLGPATDGGYYLIGLRRLEPSLFQGIAWGTDTVRHQTLQIAESLGLAIALLDQLSDVDYPEDLAVWERVNPSAIGARISVIVPMLNEAAQLKATCKPLLQRPGIEVIGVDGGSRDETVAIAQSLGIRTLASAPGRATQMNQGAAIATGQILLFLHADTQLPEDFDQWVRQTLAQPGVVAGAFELKIAGTLPGLRWVEWGVKWRSRLLQMPYGDQALFLTAEQFRAMGGFPEQPFMEDFELVRRLRTRGRIAIAPVPVLTSGRRWETLGVLRTTLLNQAIILAYRVGVPCDRLLLWYRGATRSRSRHD